MNGGAWVTSTANKDMMFYGSPATIAGKTKDADRWLPRVNGAGRSRARARGPRRGRGGGMRQSTNGGRTGCSAAGVSCAYASQVLTAWTVVVGGTERA